MICLAATCIMIGAKLEQPF